MTEVTRILNQIEDGDPSAAERLLPLVYDELRKLAAQKLANEKPGQTLQATALVHEAYIRLVENENAYHWNSRGHFFGAAAEAMRRLLVNRARDKKRLKRGGDKIRVEFQSVTDALQAPADELLAIHEAIEALENQDEVSAALVKLRFFAGQSLKEAASCLELSERTAYRHWAFAQAWLMQQLNNRPEKNNEKI